MITDADLSGDYSDFETVKLYAFCCPLTSKSRLRQLAFW